MNILNEDIVGDGLGERVTPISGIGILFIAVYLRRTKGKIVKNTQK